MISGGGGALPSFGSDPTLYASDSTPLSMTWPSGIARRLLIRAGTRAVDLGEPSVYQKRGGAKFEIKHKTAFFKKVSLLIGKARSLLGACPVTDLT